MKKLHIHDKLIEKCKKGSSKAQFEIYKLYYKGMYNVSLRIVQNADQAEDIMQEAFLSAFNKINTWSQEVTFGAWLKRIVVNKSLDYLKKRKLEISPIDDKDIVEESDYNEPDQSLNMKVKLVKKVVDELPEKYRIVTLMFLFEGFTHIEIGDLLEIKPETSRIRFMRAKEMILKTPGLETKIHDIILN